MDVSEAKQYLKNIVLEGTPEERIALFSFNNQDSVDNIYKKFQYFSKGCYIRYFKGDDAPFHKEMVLNFIKSYRGGNYVDLVFRGGAKTALAKLFLTFVILNDTDKFRKYIKILSRDLKNSKQIVTDVFNMCLEVRHIYGDMFEKQGEMKREERMDSFTMKSGVKVTAGTVGQTQRGHLQDAYRPDWLWFEDIEDRESITSQVITEGVIARCDEAISGLDKNGSWMVTGNYISENGTIQWFLDKTNKIQQIVPIMIDGVPTWSIYTLIQIEQLKQDAEDFYGEYMSDPSRSEGKFFSIDRIEEDLKDCKEPSYKIGESKYWNGYLSHHRYGIGADTAEGVGLDSSALANFDFTTGELVTTYHSNIIKPELFAYEMARVGREYGECIIAPEINNMSGGIVIITLKNIYSNIFIPRDPVKVKEREGLKLGWHTNSRTKPQMFMDFRRDYNDGIVHIYDSSVLKEMKSFTNNDITERENVVANKLTRHFDLLTAVVIAWQMRNEGIRNRNEAVVTYHELD